MPADIPQFVALAAILRGEVPLDIVRRLIDTHPENPYNRHFEVAIAIMENRPLLALMYVQLELEDPTEKLAMVILVNCTTGILNEIDRKMALED